MTYYYFNILYLFLGNFKFENKCNVTAIVIEPSVFEPLKFYCGEQCKIRPDDMDEQGDNSRFLSYHKIYGYASMFLSFLFVTSSFLYLTSNPFIYIYIFGVFTEQPIVNHWNVMHLHANIYILGVFTTKPYKNLRNVMKFKVYILITTSYHATSMMSK